MVLLNKLHVLYRSDFIQKIIETISTRLLIVFLGLISGVIIARILGPEGRGLFAVAAAVTGTGIQFANLGLHASNTYYVAKDVQMLPVLYKNTINVSLIIGMGGALLAGLVFFFFPDLVKIDGFLLVLALIWIPFGLLFYLLQNLLIGIHEVRLYNKLATINSSLSIALILIFYLLGFISVESVYGCSFLSIIVVNVLILSFFNNALKNRGKIKSSFKVFKENLKYGIRSYFSAFCGFLIFTVDIFMVNYYLGAEKTGYYSIAVGLTNIIYILPQTVGLIFFPKICNMEQWKEKFLFTCKTSIVIGAVISFIIIFCILFIDIIITILFGKDFLPVTQPFFWLLPGVLFWSMENIFRRLLISDGYPIFVVYAWVVTLSFNIVMNLFLIPKYKMIGAAAASSLSMVLLTILTSIYVTMEWQRKKIIHK